MPAVSKDQQRAAAAALKAKRDGTVRELPKGSASAEMARSMSAKELEDFANTEHEGLPKNKPSEPVNEQWEDAFLDEEMVAMDGDENEDQIVTDKSKVDIITDKDKEDKENKKTWAHVVAGVAHSAGHPLTNNTGGAARPGHFESKDFDFLNFVIEEIEECGITGLSAQKEEAEEEEEFQAESYDPNSLDLLFEQSDHEDYVISEHHILEEGGGSHNPNLGETDEEKVRRYRGMADAAYRVGDNLAGDEYTSMAHSTEEKMNITSERWKRIAGVTLKENLQPDNHVAAKKYIAQLVEHGWSWNKIKTALVEDYKYRKNDVEGNLKQYWNNLTRVK